MKTKTVIALDRLVGIFIAYPLNILVRLVGKITRFDHSLEKEMTKIVVCKFKGMGSIIQATPLLQTLRTRYPNAKIVFVSSEENRAILNRIELVDDIFCVQDKGFFRLIKSTCQVLVKLIRFRADVYIDLEIYSNYSSIITTLSLAKDRFGYYLRSNRYRLGMYTHMMYFNTKAPIAEAYLQFARLLKITDIAEDLYAISANSAFDLKDIHSKYIVINANASDLRYERRWPHQSFIKFIECLRLQKPNLPIYLIGSKGEMEYVDHVYNPFQSDELVINLSGRTNLDQLIELLRNAEMIITNDTGPMHLAASLNTRVLALFGPCSPNQYGLGKNVKPLYKNIYCSPCVHEFVSPPCKGNNQCMQLISVEEVLNAYLNYDIKPVISTSIQYSGKEQLTLGVVVR
jgi:ADP-heptose:LPS heptosyltransferase